MVKTLLNKLKAGACLVAAVASIGLAGCKCPLPEPIPPTPPVDPTLPTLTLPNNANVIEGQSTPVDLSQYKDSFGNSVTWESVVNYDNQSFLTPILNGNQLTVSANNAVDKDYPYQVDLKFKDNINGKENTASLKGTIENLMDISGTVESDEGVRQTGAIKVYDASDLTTPIGQTTSDVNGNFVPFQLNKRISQAVLRAKFTPDGFVRTIRLDGIKDYDLTHKIIVVPYETGWTQTDVNNFIEHMRRVNFLNENGLEKWNYGELPDDSLTTYSHPTFKGIQISNNFLSIEQDDIENAIRNSGHLKAGSINIVRGENHYLELGWGFIRLSNPGEAPGTYVYEQYGGDGYIERFLTNLTHLQATDKGLVNHEIVGHGLLYPGHADSDSVAALFNSIMKYTSYDNRYSPPERPVIFTPIDIKGNYLIDEQTYKGMEQEDNILRTIF
jgi:hypothetical protein